MSSYDSFLANELARHHAALDRAERLADERRERLPDTLQADIDDADLGLLFEIIGGDLMLDLKFRELLIFSIGNDRTDETVCNAARAFAAELLDVCVDLCVESDRDSLPWDIKQVRKLMPVISDRRLAERRRAASFGRSAA